MLGSEIKLLIVDFDGTLVDTFRANFMAYQEAFNQVGLALKEVDYRHCFGFRFEKFMATVGITDPVVTQMKFQHERQLEISIGHLHMIICKQVDILK